MKRCRGNLFQGCSGIFLSVRASGNILHQKSSPLLSNLPYWDCHSKALSKWCSRGVVSTFSSRKTIGISGFFRTFSRYCRGTRKVFSSSRIDPFISLQAIDIAGCAVLFAVGFPAARADRIDSTQFYGQAAKCLSVLGKALMHYLDCTIFKRPFTPQISDESRLPDELVKWATLALGSPDVTVFFPAQAGEEITQQCSIHPVCGVSCPRRPHS